MGGRVGGTVGHGVGREVGVAVSWVDGDTDGATDGGMDGIALGTVDGAVDGWEDGLVLGGSNDAVLVAGRLVGDMKLAAAAFGLFATASDDDGDWPRIATMTTAITTDTITNSTKQHPAISMSDQIQRFLAASCSVLSEALSWDD